jgi:sucrose-6F-phosphate phosphohydrolase
MAVVNNLYQQRNDTSLNFVNKTAYGKKLGNAKLFVISDLDGTLVEGTDVTGLKEFSEWIHERRKDVAFGIASGRNRTITEEAIISYGLPKPDIIICSAGSEIYYTDKFIADKGWDSHIDYQWKRDELHSALKKFPGIRLQEDAAQWPYKLSYYVEEHFNDDDLADLYKFLDDHKLRAKVLLTDNKFLDLLPFRASKEVLELSNQNIKLLLSIINPDPVPSRIILSHFFHQLFSFFYKLLGCDAFTTFRLFYICHLYLGRYLSQALYIPACRCSRLIQVSSPAAGRRTPVDRQAQEYPK